MFLERSAVETQSFHGVRDSQRLIFFHTKAHIAQELQHCDLVIQIFQDEIGRGFDIPVVIVDAWNDGNPQDKGLFFLCDTGQIGQDLIIADPCVLLVHVRIHMFDIRDDDVRIGKDFFNLFPVGIKSRFAACGDLFGFAGTEEGCHKIALQQRFPSRYRDAAAGTIIVPAVPADFLHALFYRHGNAPGFDGFGGACIGTLQTAHTFLPVHKGDLAAMEDQGIMPAGFFTKAAFFTGNTFGPIDPGLADAHEAFGIAAPAAAQRAAFQEQFRPHARSVIDGKTLDVEDEAFF